MNTASKIIPLHADQPLLLRQLHEQVLRIESLLNDNNKRPLCIPTKRGTRLIRQNQIVRCESSSNYTNVFLLSGEKLCISKTLKWISERISFKDFYRIHNSHLVRIDQISIYNRSTASSIILRDGFQLPVSRNRRQLLDKLLK